MQSRGCPGWVTSTVFATRHHPFFLNSAGKNLLVLLQGDHALLHLIPRRDARRDLLELTVAERDFTRKGVVAHTNGKPARRDLVQLPNDVAAKPGHLPVLVVHGRQRGRDVAVVVAQVHKRELLAVHVVVMELGDQGHGLACAPPSDLHLHVVHATCPLEPPAVLGHLLDRQHLLRVQVEVAVVAEGDHVVVLVNCHVGVHLVDLLDPVDGLQVRCELGLLGHFVSLVHQFHNPGIVCPRIQLGVIVGILFVQLFELVRLVSLKLCHVLPFVKLHTNGEGCIINCAGLIILPFLRCLVPVNLNSNFSVREQSKQQAPC
mmetsp:Transcript_32919/g.82692  ORF Transcript_32919/g.82692 Transcript_32919/m.82692 type:complete len:318 (+) Transcript_32919:80-1033(+)